MNLFLVATIIFVVFASPSYGLLTQYKKLSASNPSPGALFGRSVAVSDSFAVVSTLKTNPGDTPVYVYNLDTNTNFAEQKLSFVTGNADSWQVVIEGNSLIVGGIVSVYAVNLSPGKAYAFNFNGNEWVLQQELIRNDSVEDEGFGASVQLRNGIAAVGTPGDNRNSNRGAVYIYQLSGNTWQQIQKLDRRNDSDKGDTYDFGLDIALTNDHLVVGAYTPGFTGFVFVYNKTGSLFTLQERIRPAIPDNLFGSGVAFVNNFLLCIATKGLIVMTLNDNNSTFNVVDEILGNEFQSIASFNNFVVVGSPTVDTQRGSVLVFRVDDNGIWSQESVLSPSDSLSGDNYGKSVAISSKFVITGGMKVLIHPQNFANAGAAYLFSTDVPPGSSGSGVNFVVLPVLILMVTVAILLS